MKNKSDTVADLKFNWTFDLLYKSVEDTKSQFEKLNPKLSKYKIKPGNYKFNCFDKFLVNFHVTESEPLSHLIDCVNYTLYSRARFEPTKPLKLLKFELISQSEYEIHVEEVKE
jgi:hypothetical protein